MAKSTVTNISNGPRGAYLDGQLIMAEAGETIEADDFNKEWFRKGKVPADAADEDEGGKSLSSMTKAELLETAKTEGVEDVTEDNNKAEIIEKIEAARAQ